MAKNKQQRTMAKAGTANNKIDHRPSTIVQSTPWFHAIGICGKATANVAKMFKDMGWFVTGTDLQFFPPASKIIEENNIPFEQGYHFSHMTREFWEEKLEETQDFASVQSSMSEILVFGEKNENAEYRRSVGAVVFDPEMKEVIGLDWKLFDALGIVQGGLEAGEDEIEALKREIFEETGYLDFEIEQKLGANIESYYYADNKKKWLHVDLSCYVVKLKSLKKQAQALEENEKFDVKWIDINEFINIVDSHVPTKEHNFQGIAEFLKRAQSLMNSHENSLHHSIPENPDLTLIVESASEKNKEYLFAKNKGLDIRPYSQILGEYLVKENSIVVIGTAGKTTTTALITKLITDLDFEPSYMIGAEVKDFPDSLKNTDSNWSVMEGDEYHSKTLSRGAKFLEYKPKYLVITNIGYEHQDVFSTQEDYIEEFAKCVRLVPEDGIIVAKAGDENVDKALVGAKCKVIRYRHQAIGAKQEEISRNQKPETRNYPAWTVDANGLVKDEKGRDVLQFQTNLIGEYNLENILASVALICNLPANVMAANLLLQGTASLRIMSRSIAEFQGPKKRLEVLYSDSLNPEPSTPNITVVDDFGVAPDRARNSLTTLKAKYPDHKIIAVFEPNSGSRMKDEKVFKKAYKDAFKNADEVIIPDLSNFGENLATAEEFVKWLNEINVDAKFIESGNLLSELQSSIIHHQSSVLIVFFSAYRLTEIAESLVKQIQKNAK